MSKPTEKPAFLGTYFDRDAVLRLARWTRIVAWAILAVYLLQYGYDTFMTLFNSIRGGYPVDWYYMMFSLARPLQGVMLLVVLHVLSSGLLVLLDIEENTRRAARNK
jgi:hypothetical protein